MNSLLDQNKKEEDYTKFLKTIFGAGVIIETLNALQNKCRIKKHNLGN